MQKHSIVTTSWDDGHIDDIRLADLLKKYSLPATLYISPYNREWKRDELLDEDAICAMSKDFDIGAHTLTHPVLTNISLDEAEAEIKGSKIYLEDLLNKEIPVFCYPKGLFNTQIKQLVRKAGFSGARTIQAFRTNFPKDTYEMGTTNHTVNCRLPYSLIIALANDVRFVPLVFTKDWLEFSKRTFDVVRREGGVWHFWSHSWQVTNEGWWSKLEELFSYIANHDGVLYLTNSQLLAHIHTETPA